MILFIGPLYRGQRQCAENLLAQTGQVPDRCRILEDTQNEAIDCRTPDDLRAAADRLTNDYDILLFTETGSGVVPVDDEERRVRENAGRLSVLLAERAEEVYRVVCGLPTKLK